MLNGDNGDDFIYGNEGNDTIHGNNDQDCLRGNAGDDIIYGDAGQDTMYGHDGNDTIDGGAGNDLIRGNNGNDLLTGGTGNDVFYFTNENGATNKAGLQFGNDIVTDFTRGQDVLFLEGMGNFVNMWSHISSMLSSDANGNAVINFGNSSITLVGINKDSLTISDFRISNVANPDIYN